MTSLDTVMKTEDYVVIPPVACSNCGSRKISQQIQLALDMQSLGVPHDEVSRQMGLEQCCMTAVMTAMKYKAITFGCSQEEDVVSGFRKLTVGPDTKTETPKTETKKTATPRTRNRARIITDEDDLGDKKVIVTQRERLTRDVPGPDDMDEKETKPKTRVKERKPEELRESKTIDIGCGLTTQRVPRIISTSTLMPPITKTKSNQLEDFDLMSESLQDKTLTALGIDIKAFRALDGKAQRQKLEENRGKLGTKYLSSSSATYQDPVLRDLVSTKGYFNEAQNLIKYANALKNYGSLTQKERKDLLGGLNLNIEKFNATSEKEQQATLERAMDKIKDKIIEYQGERATIDIKQASTVLKQKK